MRRIVKLAILIVITIVTLLGCTLITETKHEDYPLPAPLATDLTILAETPEPTPTPIFHGLRWLDENDEATHSLTLEPIVYLHKLSISGEEDEYALAYYSDSKQQIINVTTGEYEQLLTPELPNYGEAHLSDLPLSIAYSPHMTKTEHYITFGNKHLYRFDYSTSEYVPIYTFERVIYGFSASPSGDHIAVLLNAEETLGAYADLIILNRNGKITEEIELFAYMSKSDGLVYPYPIEWKDDDTIVSNQISSEGTQVSYSLVTKNVESVPLTDATLSEDELVSQQHTSSYRTPVMRLKNEQLLIWESSTGVLPYINRLQH